MNRGVRPTDRGDRECALGESHDIGQDATDSAREENLRAARETQDGERPGSQVDGEHQTTQSTQTIVAVGHRVQGQVGQDPDRQETVEELRAWRPALAPDALVILDDFSHPEFPGVRDAVQERNLTGQQRGTLFVHDVGLGSTPSAVGDPSFS